MNKEQIKLRFKEDCKKLGIELFDFEGQDGPWRELYLLHAVKGKPGRRNSDERLTRVGARLESRIQNGERQKIVFETLRKEFAAMRKSAEGIEAAFDHDFTNKSFINILEKYRKRLEDGHKQLAKLMNNKEAYYLVRSQTTKVKVTPSKLKAAKNHSS